MQILEFEHGRDITTLGREYRRSLDLENKSSDELYKSLWGDTVSVISKASATFLNLECCVTSSENKWPGKAFNYRMNPANIVALRYFPNVFACCANNHILDYGYKGQKETEVVLNSISVKHAGTGENSEEAEAPVVFDPNAYDVIPNSSSVDLCFRIPRVMVYSFSDHGSCQRGSDGRDTWASSPNRPGLNFLDIQNMDKMEMEAIADRLSLSKLRMVQK